LPPPKRISDRKFMYLLIAVFALGSIKYYDEELHSLLLYPFFGLLIIFFLFLLRKWRKEKAVEPIRDELKSFSYDDEAIKKRLQYLENKGNNIPSIIYSLLDNKPPSFSENEMDKFRDTLEPEQWNEGMEIKSKWQKEIRDNHS